MEENELEIFKPPRAAGKKDSHFNYVDRVRVRDQGNFKGPGRTGGWRHRSLSSIDLSSNSSRSKDHTCSGPEVYSRLNGVRDYEDFYAVNNKVKKNNSLYDHIERRTNTDPITVGNTACSLRRTRSLAVIREETYPDLRVTGVRNRRSQLIPRAKLIEKDVFREKYRKKNSEGDTDSAKSQSSKGSEDFYTNLKRLDIIGVATEDVLRNRSKDKKNWQTEKSDDLDSLDSSYFRDSSHQLSIIQDPSRTTFRTDTDGKHYPTTNSHLAETTTSNSGYSPDPVAHGKRSTENQVTESDSLLGIRLLDDVLNSEEPNLTSGNNTINSKRTEGSEKPVTKLVIKLDGKPNCNRAFSETSAKRPSPPGNDFYKTRDEIKSIVSYDSIYLSSEAASDEDDNLYSKPSEVYVSNNHSGDTDVVEISLDDYDEITDPSLKEYSDTHKLGSERAARANIDDILEDENCLDTLYSQVNKSKPKIVGVEPKTSFASSRSDKASLSRSDRYSVLSNRTSVDRESQSSSRGPTNRYKKNPKVSSSHQNHHYKEKRDGNHPHAQGNHYYSLPDINIGKLLSDSEKIDAKLRLSSETSQSDLNLGAKLSVADYDLANNCTARQYRRRQRENCELILSEPNAVDELPREAPSIEVETPYKDPNDVEPTSLDTFGSDQESLQPNLFTVSIGGKQVIVDEVDKLNLEKSKNKNNLPRRSNSLRDNKVLKESIANRDSEIKVYKQHPSELEAVRPTADCGYEKDIKDYFEERLLKKVNEVNESLAQTVANNKKNKPKKVVAQSSKAKQNNSLSDMPRPQIMNVIHSNQIQAEQEKSIPTTVVEAEQEAHIDSTQIVEAQQEFHEKVDSIRCYWSKLATTSPDQAVRNGDEDDEDEKKSQEIRHVDDIVKFLEKDTDKASRAKLQNNFLRNLNNKPTVEIIEFDDKTQTAVVKARSAENVFDHVRYKVVKTETFQKNLQFQKHKEAQFDGLMQYLQDYSFQELLANNNVVIIEPVRTKIEIISEKPVINARNPACKITGVRVNKELIEEELPCPDTVRNVRKLFEGSSLLRVRSASKDNIAVNTSTMAIRNVLSGTNVYPASTKTGCPTTTVAAGTGSVLQSTKPKWDAASLSSGVSSGELSSPCECADIVPDIGNLTDDHVGGGKCCDPSYVSQDVLEKIRARGSTVTYYGGKVLDKRSCANGIMQDIYKNRCIACQPLNCPDPEEVSDKMNFSSNSNYLGVRFKLVKSNSCSSRLELVGTGKINSLQQHQQINQQMSQNMKRDEDKRRSILYRLQQSSATVKEGAEPGEADSTDALNSCAEVFLNGSESAVTNEKCVKQIVELLETTTAAVAAAAAVRQSSASAPRIIDSKSVEKLAKTTDECAPEKSAGQTNRTQTGAKNCQSSEQKATAPVITVNNSISIAHTGDASAAAVVETTELTKIQVKQRQESIYAVAKMAIQQQQQKIISQHTAKQKVVRNRNVDLALSIVKGQKSGGGSEPIYSQATNVSMGKEAKDSHKESELSSRPILTTFSQQHHQLKHKKVKVVASKDPVKDKLPVNGSVAAETHQNQLEKEKNVENGDPKMVKWSSLNPKFDEKFYVTNDSKLKQKKINDDMEFEEFEVYDTVNECYDSLNSDK